ncbi:alkaline phosphatase family protein [Phycicoccus sp. SLBN-51]|uniref:alkaline phosphatase family protein n=1 Tax=Phycicoccus sp. SLBN-51 TaxID=2768447 RepID=UPI0011733163|nr:alkaline phosphatase family protein [Phycicoccus sp. SLBN-51]TQJ49800.1 type I phosphodiesterase/nucleotide pyrophosphatase [Phycicoccus sp. SLBN-51]
MPHLGRAGDLVPTLRDLADAGWGLLTTSLGLGAAIALVDGVTADGPVPVILVAVTVAVGDFLLRPLLRLLALGVGAIGAMVAGLLAQVALAWGALLLVPGIGVTDWGAVLVVLVVASVVMALGRWLVGANDSSYVLGDIMRRARSRARARERRGEPALPTEAGLLLVQLDGLSRSALEQAIEAGLAPTMARWLREGTHHLTSWWSQVPSTTPSAQAGVLHGNNQPIPAFRWWDKELGRLVVANRPQDSALVESRVSDGNGLLAHGGVAISTMFSGDAQTRLLVMSAAGAGGGLGPGPSFLRFFASPFVLSRALSRSVLEMVKELYQGRRQRVRNVVPRVRRQGWYVVLRGISNVLLRDLNVSLVAEHLVRGTPAIYVNLVDYDEIAHHAGPSRPEALRALEGLDGVLALLEQVLLTSGRSYRVVVLSDHGQSLGATFRQVEGTDLATVCRGLLEVPDSASVEASEGEAWGPVNTLLTTLLSSRPARRPVVVGPDRHRPEAAATEQLPELAVVASGNLGAVWFPRLPGRLTLEEVHERWPRLVPGLVSRDSIGVVVAQTESRGPVAVGRAGLCVLGDGAVEGEDPLAQYGPRGRADLLRCAGLDNAADLIVVSSVDAYGQVHAFEEQVGSHGGLGGQQNEAVLLYPADLPVEDGDPLAGGRELVGSEELHDQLVAWMRRLGVRP